MQRLDPAIVKQQIDSLRAAWPDVFGDDDTWAISVESQTDLHEFLREIERKREDAEALETALKLTMDNLRERRERFERREKAMRALMFSAMQWADLTRVELAEATLSIRNGQPKVLITDEAAIPDEFMRIKKEPDKTLIKTALNNFEDVPGATMSNVEPVLAVRVK